MGDTQWCDQLEDQTSSAHKMVQIIKKIQTTFLFNPYHEKPAANFVFMIPLLTFRFHIGCKYGDLFENIRISIQRGLKWSLLRPTISSL